MSLRLRSMTSAHFAVAVALLGMLCGPMTAAAAPGGRGGRGGAGGGRGAGPGGGGAGVRGPSVPGRAELGPGVGSPVGPGPGRGIESGPRTDIGRPVEQGRPVDAGRPGGPAGVAGPAGPAGRGSVENFIGAKPAAKAKSTTAQGRVDSMQAALQGRTQPFTADWYAEHPGAWRYSHPYAGWWGVAGTAGLAAWLGYSIGAGSSAVTTSSAATTDGAAAEASASSQATASAETAATPPADLEWMPLGVFATGPKGIDHAHIYLQLAVSRTGEIKGNYYDAVSDATQPITGSIDRETRKATWAVGKGATFATTLEALTQTPSDVSMKTGGVTQAWELVQMEQPKPAAGP